MQRKWLANCLLFLFLCVSFNVSFSVSAAAKKPDQPCPYPATIQYADDDCLLRIELRDTVFDPLHEKEIYAIDLRAKDETGYYLVQFKAGYDYHDIDAFLQQAQAVRHGDFRHYTVLIKTPLKQKQLWSLKKHFPLRWIGVYHPANRLSAHVYLGRYLDKRGKPLDADQAIQRDLYLFTETPQTLKKIHALATKVVPQKSNKLWVQLPVKNLPALLAIPDIAYVAPPLQYQLLNDHAVPIIGNNAFRNITLTSLNGNTINNITASSEYVIIADTGFSNAQDCSGLGDCKAKNPNIHPDFLTPYRLSALSSALARNEISVNSTKYRDPHWGGFFSRNTNLGPDFDGHGTHVAGSISAKGSTNGDGRGTSSAQILFQSLSPVLRSQLQGQVRCANATCATNNDYQWSTCFGGTLMLSDDDDDYLPNPYGYTEMAQVATTDLLAEFLNVSKFRTASIHNFSLGSCAEQNYAQVAQDIDDFFVTNQSQIGIYAAGNTHNFWLLKNGDITQLEENELTDQARAKNVVTVGASMTDRGGNYRTQSNGIQPIPADDIGEESIWALSSTGEDFDWGQNNSALTVQVKPDVVAPGTFILSSRASGCKQGEPVPPNDYTEQDFSHQNCVGWGLPVTNDGDPDRFMYMSGTSMAAPFVSGSVALARSYFVRVKNIRTPSASLLKAAVVHFAHSLTGDATQAEDPAPSHEQGWGRIDLASSLIPFNKTTPVQFYDETLAAGNTFVFTGQQAPYAPIRFSQQYPAQLTLVWQDAATDPTGKLVNNLSLKLIDPDGRQYHSNVFQADDDPNYQDEAVSVPFPTNANAPTPDTHNNVQKIILNTPPADGFYHPTVIAKSLPQPRQSYSLLFSNVIGADATDAMGKRQDHYTEDVDQVYFSAVGQIARKAVDACIVSHPNNFLNQNNVAINDVHGSCTTIPACTGTASGNCIDTSGSIQASLLWSAPIGNNPPLQYNIVIDANQDGVYNSRTDVVDYYNQPGFVVGKGDDIDPIVGLVIATALVRQVSVADKNLQAAGVGFPKNTDIELYTVPTVIDRNWNDIPLKDIMLPIPGTPLKITTDSSGNFGPVTFWQNIDNATVINAGRAFNLVADVADKNGNFDGVYTQGVDGIDTLNVDEISAYLVKHQVLQQGVTDDAVSQLKIFLNAWADTGLNASNNTFDSATAAALQGFLGQDSISLESQQYDTLDTLAQVGFVVQPKQLNEGIIGQMPTEVGIFDQLDIQDGLLLADDHYYGIANAITVSEFDAQSQSNLFLTSGTFTLNDKLNVLDDALFSLIQQSQVVSSAQSNSTVVRFSPGASITVSSGASFTLQVNTGTTITPNP